MCCEKIYNIIISKMLHFFYRHYLETRSSNERLETKDRRAVFRDHEEDSRGACKDKERDRDRDGSRCRERDRGRDRDRDWHHYSKSSGNSRRSSRHRHRHRRSHHHSDSVWPLSASHCHGNCLLSVPSFLLFALWEFLISSIVWMNDRKNVVMIILWHNKRVLTQEITLVWYPQHIRCFKAPHSWRGNKNLECIFNAGLL